MPGKRVLELVVTTRGVWHRPNPKGGATRKVGDAALAARLISLARVAAKNAGKPWKAQRADLPDGFLGIRRRPEDCYVVTVDPTSGSVAGRLVRFRWKTVGGGALSHQETERLVVACQDI